MDWILLGFLIFFSLKGFFRGFFDIVFSLTCGVIVFLIAFKFSQNLANVLANSNLFNFEKPIASTLDRILKNQLFSNIDDFLLFLSQTKSIFSLFLFKICNGISFDGAMSAGQILSPTINLLLHKWIAFCIIFLIGILCVGVLRFILKKWLKKLGASGKNRIFGALLGAVKGLLFFALFFIVFSNFANISLSEKLINFCQSGRISNFIYINFFEKILWFV